MPEPPIIDHWTQEIERGTQRWRDKDNLVHREDGPAKVLNGVQSWWRHGYLRHSIWANPAPDGSFVIDHELQRVRATRAS